MARKQAATPGRRKGGGWLALLGAILVVAAYLAYLEWQRRQTAPPPPEQNAELVSDDRIVYGGLPRARSAAAGEPSFEVLRSHAYIAGYSESRRDPLWVTYRVCHTDHPFSLPRPAGFSTDLRTTVRVRESDFAHSGYDRGHMAPNSAIAHCFGAEAQVETFLLTNVCPQSPALNEKVWERLEVDERHYADTLEEVWVIDGPIFGDLNGGQTPRLATGIAVPTAFYKILIDEQDHPGGRPRVFSVIMPQNVKGTELPQEFLTSVSEIERETGLEFFWKLDAATRAQLEEKVWSMW